MSDIENHSATSTTTVYTGVILTKPTGVAYCNIYRHMTICIHVIFHDVIYSLSKTYHCIAHFNDKKKKYDQIKKNMKESHTKYALCINWIDIEPATAQLQQQCHHSIGHHRIWKNSIDIVKFRWFTWIFIRLRNSNILWIAPHRRPNIYMTKHLLWNRCSA